MIYRFDLAVSEVTLHSVQDFFEALVVKLITGCGRTIIAVLYHLPWSEVTQSHRN